MAVLPPGSQRDLVDPFAEKRKPWGWYAALVVVLLLAGGWYLGKLDNVLPGKIKSTTVLGTNAPAYTPAGLHPSADSGGTNTNVPPTDSPAK